MDVVALQRRAEAHLPPSAPALAEEALAHGALRRDAAERHWEASHGHVRGVRLVLVVHTDVLARLRASPSTVDALTKAVAAAVSEHPGTMLADLAIEAGDVAPRDRGSSPYRGG